LVARRWPDIISHRVVRRPERKQGPNQRDPLDEAANLPLGCDKGPRRPPKDETVPRYWYQGGSLPRTLTIEPILLRTMIVDYLASFKKYCYPHTNSDWSA
jgi:hypothetical protein